MVSRPVPNATILSVSLRPLMYYSMLFLKGIVADRRGCQSWKSDRALNLAKN